MGIELARRFEGFEVQIATHIDRDHWHNHLIVNSVSCETGLKLQFNEKDLEQLRTLSDEICAAHGLEILKPYEKPIGRDRRIIFVEPTAKRVKRSAQRTLSAQWYWIRSFCRTCAE